MPTVSIRVNTHTHKRNRSLKRFFKIKAATDAHKKVLDPLGLELKVVVIQVMQVLQIKSGPRQEQYACFTSESLLQP